MCEVINNSDWLDSPAAFILCAVTMVTDRCVLSCIVVVFDTDRISIGISSCSIRTFLRQHHVHIAVNHG